MTNAGTSARPAPAFRRGTPSWRGHFGAWRALTALPAMVGSLLLLLVLFGWLGQWEGLVLLAWAASGAMGMTRRGERVVAAVGYGLRQPSRAQMAVLDPVWVAALARADIAGDHVDLYVQRSEELNAFAIGGRTVAVTTGVLHELLARRLGNADVEAVFLHELGHHATRGTRLGLISAWLATPWRFASRLFIGLGLATVGRRQPMRLLAIVVTAAVVVAVGHAIRHGQVLVASVLFSVALCAVVCPLADAWVCRRSEYAADQFAADHGAGPQLVDALIRMRRRRARTQSWTARALSRHPSIGRRAAAMGDR
jgi:STE24 endopeptidase